MKDSSLLFILLLSLALIISCGESDKEKTATGQGKSAHEEGSSLSQKNQSVKPELAQAEELPDGEEIAAAEYYAKKPIKGRIVSLNDIMTSSPLTMNKEKTSNLLRKGQMLVFLAADGEIYMIYNPDGSYAVSNFVRFANSKHIGIIGKVKTIAGQKIIIVDKISAMN